MSKYFAVIFALVWKDVLLEIRNKDFLISVMVFALLTIVVFGIAIDPKSSIIISVASGVFWISISFACVLGMNRAFIIEYENGGIFGLLSAPISRDAIYFGKMLGCFVFLLVVELFLFPIFVILFNVDLFDLLLIAVFVLTSLGLACVGTLASVMAINTRLRELLLPLIFLPVVIPIIIAAVTLTEMFLSGTKSEDFIKWIGMIVAFDLMFLALCPFAFNYILHE